MRSRAASASWPDYVLAGSVGTLVLLAWSALWLWGRSPSGHLLMHGSAHVAEATVNLWYFGAMFVLGWTLMTVAMMLPTAVPLLVMFRRMVASRSDTWQLLLFVIGGY